MGANEDLGPFELHEEIGSGAMGTVYKGVQKKLGRKVALKILHPHLARYPRLVARFEGEALRVAKLNHANIVQIHDAGHVGNWYFIAMEYVEGSNLAEWVETHGTLPFEIALLMLRDLCSGLGHAHARNIVHRDIKPANLMLTPEGIVKIMDFGLARGGEGVPSITVANETMGTAYYMSPEQAAGQNVDARSDIFSVGVVAYEWLGGERPFRGDTFSAVLHSIVDESPPPLGALNRRLPIEVVAIVQRMLQKDPAKRYLGMGQVRNELEAVLGEQCLNRWRELLCNYVTDPARVGDSLRRKRAHRHFNQARHFETLGRGRIGDAIREYELTVVDDADNIEAHARLDELKREWQAEESEPSGFANPVTVRPHTEPISSGFLSGSALNSLKNSHGVATPEVVSQARSRRWLAAVAALLAVGFVVVIVLMLSRGSLAVATPPLHSADTTASAKPPVVVPYTNSDGRQSTEATRLESRGEEAVPTPLRPSRYRHRVPVISPSLGGPDLSASESLPLSAGPAEAANLAPKIPPAETHRILSDTEIPGTDLRLPVSETGGLDLRSGTESAEIILNGKPTGRMTPCVFRRLRPGTYTVSLLLSGYTVLNGSRQLLVKAGANTRGQFELYRRLE